MRRCVWFVSLALFAQDDVLRDDVIRSGTRLVQVNLLAAGRDGRPIRDLQASEITVMQDGRPQAVALFEVVSSSQATPPEPLPPNVFSNQIKSGGAPITSVTAIVLDALNTQFQDRVYAQEQVRAFLRRLTPKDRVALYILGSRLVVLHDYTTDTQSLLDKLEKFRGSQILDFLLATSDQAREAQAAAFANRDAPGPAAANPPLPDALAAATEKVASFDQAARILTTIRALTAISDHLAGVPGRKNLVWVSAGFPLRLGLESNMAVDSTVSRDSFTPEFQALVRSLNSSQVAVYPVDARGLMTPPETSTITPNRSARSTVPPPPTFYNPITTNQDAMLDIANQTGGRAAISTNDLAGAVRRAADDAEVSYVVGYYAPETSLDGRYHTIQVKTSRPGVELRHRRGYLAVREPTVPAADRRALLTRALLNPVEGTALQVNARVDRAGSQFAITAQVLPGGILVEPKDGKLTGTLDLMIAFRDASGAGQVAAFQTFNLALTPENYRKLAETGLILERKIAPPIDKPLTIRIVARDPATGATGSLTVPLNSVR
jgi:VWFA-related protein